MKNRDELIKKLTKDVNELKNKIEYRNLYNVRNFVIRQLIKSGIALDYAFPFILTAVIIANIQSAKGNSPFHVDEIIEKASIETIDTSTGIHIENISYDFSYEKELIEYSTGWIINEKGLYERTVTSYRLSNDIDLLNTKKILSMPKEEIDKKLIITNIKNIQKNKLIKEDYIYNQDAIIIINHLDSLDEFKIRQETKEEITINAIIYIALIVICGNLYKKASKKFKKIYIKDKLNDLIPLYKKINKEDLETLKKILELRQENLAMLNNNENNIKEQNKPFTKIRKR